MPIARVRVMGLKPYRCENVDEKWDNVLIKIVTVISPPTVAGTKEGLEYFR